MAEARCEASFAPKASLSRDRRSAMMQAATAKRKTKQPSTRRKRGRVVEQAESLRAKGVAVANSPRIGAGSSDTSAIVSGVIPVFRGTIRCYSWNVASEERMAA